MYKYTLIIAMSDGRKFYRLIGREEERLSEDKKKCFVDNVFRNGYIDFADCFALNENNEYVVLNTRQITSISICETLILDYKRKDDERC